MIKTPYLSIVIPAYNEANRLSESILRLYNQYLDTALHTFEVLIVDNASTDGTFELAEKLAEVYKNMRVIRLEEKGKGVALRHGMLAARGRWRMMADADFSMPPFEIKRLMPSMTQVSAPDIIIAERETFDRDVVTTPTRWVAGRAFNLAMRMITGLPLTDTQCGFKVFSARSALDLFSRATLDGFAIDVEILMLAKDSERYSIGGLPVHWVHNPDSRVDLIPDSIQMLRDVAAIAQRLRREKKAEEQPSAL